MEWLNSGLLRLIVFTSILPLLLLFLGLLHPAAIIVVAIGTYAAWEPVRNVVNWILLLLFRCIGRILFRE